MTIRQKITCCYHYNKSPYMGLCRIFGYAEDSDNYCPFTYTEHGEEKAQMMCKYKKQIQEQQP